METRKIMFAVPVVLVVLGAAAYAFSSTSGSPNTGETLNWTDIEVEDVRTGDTYRISQFDKPVLVETFAVWCPTCTRQQEEVRKLHEDIGDDFVSVSLDVDPNEDAAKITRHTERHGFDWRYSIAPPEMTASLQKEFGPSVLNPPSAPMILVCEDGKSRKLEFGVKPASKLKAEIENGC